MPEPLSAPSTVLIVDDHPENLVVLGGLLADEHTVRAAKDGERALELARRLPLPDLVLLDIMMPGMDGLEVLRRLRADPLTRDIPVVFVSALDGDADEEAGLALGAADYIHKPLRPAVVRQRVRNQIALARARAALRGEVATLEAEVLRRLSEKEQLQDAGIHALARLAETRDPATGSHLRRTQSYVALLADALRGHPRFAAALTPEGIATLVKCAPLHDIGKVGIPDHILLKQGPLDPAEWEIMKTHAALGADAIARAQADTRHPAPFLEIARDIARHHHEHWDGTGYPDALAGEAIPLCARLMAVADVFDALTTRRPYKAALPMETVRDMIVAQRGRHFDPDVTDAFAARFEDFRAVREQSDGDPAARLP